MRLRIVLAALLAAPACGPMYSGPSSSSRASSSSTPSSSSATHSSQFASSSSGASPSASGGAPAVDADGGTDAASATAAAPAERPFSPAPRYTEVQAYLSGVARGVRCFTNNMIRANLMDAYVDGDFNGDGRPERIFQLPDCLAVIVQGAEHWEFPVLMPRSVARDIDRVSLHAVQQGGALLVELREVHDEPRSRQVYRFRWTGTELQAVP